MTRRFLRESLPGPRSATSGLARAFALALVTAVGFGLAAYADAEPMRGKVNVNTASVEELQRLPGVGESRAQALVEARTRRGGFKSVDELVEVKGIGAASLEKLRPHVTLQGKTTASAE
jgi:competence ComEA-like helix-hairpin-helix protein